MNEQLRAFAISTLKHDLAKLSADNQRKFKLMYARDSGRRSVEDAVAMNINDVVDHIPSSQLSWAMDQVKNTSKVKP